MKTDVYRTSNLGLYIAREMKLYSMTNLGQ